MSKYRPNYRKASDKDHWCRMCGNYGADDHGVYCMLTRRETVDKEGFIHAILHTTKKTWTCDNWTEKKKVVKREPLTYE